MYPVLFRIPEFKIGSFEIDGFDVRSYGILLVLGLLFAMWLGRRRAQKWGIEPDAIVDAAFWGILPGIIGARITYIVLNWGYYTAHTDELLSFRFAGLTSFGGVIFSLVGLMIFARRAKLDVLAFFDVLAVPLLFAHSIGRIGCLLNGCCYGGPTDAWYGVHVENVVGLHQPAQIFDSVMVLVGAAFIVLYERKARPVGQSFGFTFIVWGVARFMYEFFRAGTHDEYLAGTASSQYLGDMPFTLAQAAAVLMVGLGIAMMYRFASLAASRAKEEPQG